MSHSVSQQGEKSVEIGAFQCTDNVDRINACLEQAAPEKALQTEPTREWAARALFILQCAQQGVIRAAEEDGMSREDIDKLLRLTQFAAANSTKLKAS
jgi:hypothetical protein